jgi:hypothetical protein
MLYEKNSSSELNQELFKNPTSEYRGTPFWAWNCRLDREELLRQIGEMKAMGMGGFHIHCRTGMATRYLSDDFMQLVSDCNEKAKEEHMLCWLYDEDRYSSGFAGGIVTKNLRYRARDLLFTPVEEPDFEPNRKIFEKKIDDGSKPKGYFLAKYAVTLQDDCLSAYRRLHAAETAADSEKVWYAYLELDQESPWFNNQTYVNTLDKEAIKEFVRVTHDRYYEVLGKDFGKSIPAIFTDEPHFCKKGFLHFAKEECPVKLPFTDDLNETFQQAYGTEILDSLPELIWELPDGKVSVPRYQYHDHVAERFSSAYADTVGGWCEAHGIKLTGHMLDEDSLELQAAALGEAMRSYRSFQLPGIDMLCDLRHFSTAKQAQSAVHQYGREGMMSELYGVTNWDFNFIGHKLQGDWQAALGVTVRVHHLAWVSMEGEAKRDYPASINYQSPWYREYPMIEDHFARLNTALTRGKPGVRVGIIHPVESCWIHWGPQDQTFAIRQEMEGNFQNLVRWMLFGLIDFDFIAESLFPSLCPDAGHAPLPVGSMQYDVVIVPGNYTLRATTVERLEAFQKAGGKVLFMGEPAKLVGAVPSDKVKKLSARCANIPFSQLALMNALAQEREFDIRLSDGTRTDNVFSNLRIDGSNRWLFLCHVNYGDVVCKDWRGNYVDSQAAENWTISLKGDWISQVYETLTGECHDLIPEYKHGETILKTVMYPQDSLLLFLTPGRRQVEFQPVLKPSAERIPLLITDPVPVTLSEPNNLLLDMAEYSLDGEPFHAREELLRIENILRERLGLPLKSEQFAQPWVTEGEDSEPHPLSLKFDIVSEFDIPMTSFAMEHPELAEISLNGCEINPAATGWFVDKSIKSFDFGKIKKGHNKVIITMPFSNKANVEWCYLLGDFGVATLGSHAKLIPFNNQLAFGDYSNQGLPFYAGNVIYHCMLTLPDGNLFAQFPAFHAPLLTVSVDGGKKERVAFSPYIADLGHLKAGAHRVDITSFGNRHNAFGPIHNNIKIFKKFGPNAWRLYSNGWAYEYCLKPMGVTQAPSVWVEPER